MSYTRWFRHFGVALLLAMSGWLALPVAPEAQTAPAHADMQWSDITEVVVRAKLPGPPMWKLHKGNATVWVLPKPNLTPHDLQWDTTRLSNILKHADAFYIPPQNERIKDLELPAHKKLSDFVSEATYKRVIQTLDREYLSHQLLRLRPAYLGAQIYNQTWFQYKFEGWTEVNRLDEVIEDTHVKIKDLPWNIRKVDIDFLASMTNQQSEDCLNLFLDGVDYEIPLAPAISKAWAQGELKTVLADFQDDPFDTCVMSQPKFAAEYRQVLDDPVIDLINALLDTGKGTTVMLMPLADVLKKGGILDRLREDGVEITSPPQ